MMASRYLKLLLIHHYVFKISTNFVFIHIIFNRFRNNRKENIFSLFSIININE